MRFAALFLLALNLAFAAPSWESQYFHDVKDEEMRFSSIGFCSAERGIATGVIVKKSGETKAIAMVTSDGGKKWTQIELDEPGFSVHFAEETSGWMLTPSGIWFSDECGRNWRRVHKQRDLVQVRFLDSQTGWAVGARKTVLQTSDGGKTWSKVKAAEALDVSEDRTVFQAIEPKPPKSAMILGRSTPPRRGSRLPVWLDPHPEKRRELPALTVTLETPDAGATWRPQKASVFGRISAVRTSRNGQGMLLVQFDELFEFPSEIYALSATIGNSARSLRAKDFAATDIAVSDASGSPVFYAAGFKPPGTVFRAPIPGKVRIVYSTDLKEWKEWPVDYRAVATNVTLAVKEGRAWAATDTGMILSFVPR